ncbi:MAG TPA: TonB-dependent receptor [Flavobacterium sp.]|nr:TonB-dependent receptor [Flavobacterium sp.]
MKIRRILFSVLSVNGFMAQAQVDSLELPNENTIMEEIVITGQFEPQSIKKSVHNVRVISKADIQNLAANNLGDVLNQYLNITVSPNAQTGRSSVSLFGLDSQYFKVLIDNIPIASDTGLGNNVDLTQINLDNVERIEIIEGAMGVTHGANAVSGILNIITKKNSHYDWEISASVQEETVGSEYAFFDKGRHIQNIKISHNFLNHWYVSVGANRNDFKGSFDDKQGKDYLLNDGRRGVEWLPKEQLTTNTTIGYQKNDTRIFYKFDYFDEVVEYYNPVVIPVNNYPFPETYYSNDKRFPTKRFYHHFNYYGKLFNDLTFNISASHQKQQRSEEKFNYYILSQEEVNNNSEVFHSNEVLYSTGTITNFIKNKQFDFQVGYELVNENSFGHANSGMFKDDQLKSVNIRKRMENYDVFALAEINFTDRFSLKPGFRYSFQSKFDDQQSYSLGVRYLFNKGIEARLSSGYSYRTPNFSELYSYFVDSNHNIQGNENLVPERSSYVEANLKKNTSFDSGISLYNSLTSSIMLVDDKISMVLTSNDPILQYQYINVNDYTVWNLSSDHSIRYGNWNLSAGFSLIGISQKISTGALGTTSEEDFLYTFNVNTALSYHLPETKMDFALYFKHNGKTQQFVSDINDSSQFVLSEIESYDWLDASVRKRFFDDKLEVMAGARNLLNVTDIRSTIGSAGVGGSAHASTSSNIMLGYGRSYFLKLTYNLNF